MLTLITRWVFVLIVAAVACVPAGAQITVRASAQAGTGPGTNVVFQAAGTAQSGTGNVTVAWPAHATNDIALLFVESAGGEAVTLSAPTVFAPVPGSPQSTGAGTAGTRLSVFWARATSAGMGNVTVSDPGDHVFAQILTYRGAVTTGNPWDVTGGGVKSVAGTSLTVTGVTTTEPNTLIVQAATRDNDANGAGFSAQTNANLSGLTERTDDGTNAGNGGGFAVWDGRLANAGSTGSTTATVTSSVNAFLTIALRSNAFLTVNVPAGTLDGDVMIASIAWRPCTSGGGSPCTSTVSPPSGWTVVNTMTQTAGGATGQSMVVYRRVASAEPASYTWFFGGTPVHAGAVGGIVSFAGVDTTNPVVASLGQATASSTTHVANQIDTTGVPNAMLVSSFSANSANVWSAVTAAAAMTERVDVASVAVPNDVGVSLQMNTAIQAVAGLTGSRTGSWTAPPAADTGVTHLLALRPAVTIDHFSISHAGSGVACVDQTITITAHDATHNPVDAAGLSVNLSTSNSRGTWTGIVSGGGTLSDPTAGDGAATYTFAPGSTSVQLSFRYANLSATSETFNFNVSGGGFTETTGTATAGDDPSFTMAQAGFVFRNITDANTTIPTQLSGKPSDTGFNAKTLRIQAVRTDTVTGSCTGLFASQTRTVDIGAECNSPATCAGSQVSINSGNIATSNDNGVAGTAAAYTGVSLTFNASSEADTVIAYPDAGQISLHVRFDLDPLVAGFEMIGSSNLFVVRPFGFAFRGVNAATAVAHGNTESATVLAAAGDLFTMTLGAYRWASGEDADNNGVPDAGVNITDNGLTANFAASTTVSVLANLPGIAAGTIARGAGCAGAATVASGSWSGGAATIADWCYTEAGNVLLAADTTNYITAGVNITGNSGLDGTGAAAGHVGRFRPKQFALSTAVGFTPALTNRGAAGCSPASTFTYLGEDMRVRFRLIAQNTQGVTTQNYNGVYAKLSPASASVFNFGARSGVTNLTTRLTAAYVGPAPTWSNGQLTIPALAPIQLTVARATPDNPDGPYTAVGFGIAPLDSDGVGMNTLDFDADNNAINERTSLGVSTELRFGRLRMNNANGSQLVALSLPIETQYWNGTYFITNVDDSCTTLAPANIAMSGYTQNLNACETSLTVSAFAKGRATLRLSAPGGGNNGAVLLTANLGPPASGTGSTCAPAATAVTGANRAYLLGRWDNTDQGGDTLFYDDNPVGRATFGVFGGSDEFIYNRENF